MKNAIEKAIEGGWNKESIENTDVKDMTYLLDPDFWQALGRAEGWQGGLAGIKPDWYAYWHRFIDHLAEGKTADDFFKDLLNQLPQ